MIRKLFLLLLLSSSFILCYAKDDPCLDFGKNIKVYTDLEKLFGKEGKRAQSSLDLNGDGVKDRVALLSIGEDSTPASGVNVKGTFSHYGGEFDDPPRLAIGIIHGATKIKPCQRFILTLVSATFSGEWNGDPNHFFTDEFYPSPYENIPIPLINIAKCKYRLSARYDHVCISIPLISAIYSIFWDGIEYQSESQAIEDDD